MTTTDGPAATPLPPLPEQGVRRVLCVAAHPDDLEYGASAAVAAWTEAGVEVTYLLLTRGEAGMAEEPSVVAPLREREQRAACAEVGVERLILGDQPDGMMEGGLPLRREVARVIRQVRPELVLTSPWGEEEHGGLNHADHRLTGLATADACRDAANPWVFRALREEEGLEPWSPRALLVAGHSAPTHAKALQERHRDAGVASLRAHAAYLAHVTGHPDPADLIGGVLSTGGEAAGTGLALVLRVHDLGGLADDEAPGTP